MKRNGLEPNKLLTEYSMACENGIMKLQENAQDDLLWFTCKVMPAIQKKYKPIRVDEPHQDYYHLITPSDEAFSFFCLKNYKDFTSYLKWKKEKNQRNTR